MPSTFVHGLLPSACVFVSRRTLPKLTWREWFTLLFISAIIGNSPDLDVIPASLFPQYWKAIHREVGHNIFSLVLFSYLGFKALQRWVPKVPSRHAKVVSICLVLSHVTLDGMNVASDGTREPWMGVPLLWPFSHQHFHTPFWFFPTATLDHTRHPLVAHATSVDYFTHIIFYEMICSFVVFAVYYAVLNIAWFIYQRKRQAPTTPVVLTEETTASENRALRSSRR